MGEQGMQMVSMGAAPGASVTYASAPQTGQAMATSYTYIDYSKASFIAPQPHEQITNAQVPMSSGATYEGSAGTALATQPFSVGGTQQFQVGGAGTVLANQQCAVAQATETSVLAGGEATALANADASKKKKDKKEKSSKKSSKKKKVSQKSKGCC